MPAVLACTGVVRLQPLEGSHRSHTTAPASPPAAREVLECSRSGVGELPFVHRLWRAVRLGYNENGHVLPAVVGAERGGVDPVVGRHQQ